jgi:uncharacterized surface protein with fasciclin (FAS1) repeats
MFTRSRTLPIALLTLALYTVPSVASADNDLGFGKSETVLDVLQGTDGAQAVVAAVLVVDEAKVLPSSLAELLDDRRAEVVLFAPSNAAFEDLLGLDPGSLDGLSVEEVKDALPGLLPSGVDVADVAGILLKHVALPRRANLFTASEKALLREGSVTAADESVFPVGIGASGVQINYETIIIRADLSVRNGVVHFIDTVILDGLL